MLLRFISVILLVWALPCFAFASDVQLKSYKASYKISLVDPGSTKNIYASADGELDLKFDVMCDGYATEQHMSVLLVNHEGQGMRVRLDLLSFESLDGKTMQFETTTRQAGVIISSVKGRAYIDGDTLKVITFKPKESEVLIKGGASFPTPFLIDVIKKAALFQKAQAQGLSQVIFDGTGGEPYRVSSVIYAQKPFANDEVSETLEHNFQKASQEQGNLLSAHKELTPEAFLKRQRSGEKNVNEKNFTPHKPSSVTSQINAWLVRSGFYALDQNKSEPEFQVEQWITQHGIIRQISFDYGNYKLQGKLVSLKQTNNSCD